MLHYQSDLLLNVSVIAALVLDQYLNLTGADPVFGIVIALWLLWGAWSASSHALDQLMDREWPIEKRRRFVEVAARHPAGRGIHDLRTRTSGTHEFAQFHIWVDPEMTVAAAHDVIEEIESGLKAGIPRLRGAHPPRSRRPGRLPRQRPASRPTSPRKPSRMTELRLVQVDAFADRPFTGNPAAVMPLDAWLPDEILQAIAEENNLSETAFTIPARGRRGGLRAALVHAAVEVVLCGHATLASGHVLIGERDRIRFRTRRAGMLEVARDGDGYAMSLPAWKAEPKPLPEVLAALGCEARETLWHPGRYALIVLDSEADVRAVRPISALWPRRATSSPSSPRPATRPTWSAASSPPAPASTRTRSPARPIASACPIGPSGSARTRSPASRPASAAAISPAGSTATASSSAANASP